MGKKDDLIKQLTPILEDRDRLEKFIIQNSNLPGPRGNLELAFAFSEVYMDLEILMDWIKITEDQADVNNPKSFLAFCSVVCLGKNYTIRKDQKIIDLLKNSASDNRWRMREAVAFGFQIIGVNNFDDLRKIFTEWIKNSNNLEKRAILVSLAHPPFLSEERARFCFKITDIVLKEMDRENDFKVLRKGLEFTISVFAAADPETGFSFIEKWKGTDKVIDKIMKVNLKKNRLLKKNPEEVRRILNNME